MLFNLAIFDRMSAVPLKEGYEKPVNHKTKYLPPQVTNFQQREYTEEDFEDFFDKIGEE